ncbi:hypothetical protein ACFW04_007682 [Cataglyphis niger]
MNPSSLYVWNNTYVHKKMCKYVNYKSITKCYMY